MAASNGHAVTVPPGFRFHPTDEELLYYYLRKKVAYEAIEMDVIRDIDLNKLEPWDLKDKCRIGTGPQNEWYFFSHKDKKYPTGTRTNRATTAGFWKATGRDKAIHLSNGKRIGMRKTLVFYTGRAPHGQKTDWIMHEYRLDDDNSSEVAQEDGWVVCRVFKKKNHQINNGGGEVIADHIGATHHNGQYNHLKTSMQNVVMEEKHYFQQTLEQADQFAMDNSMHLPQLMSPGSAVAPFLPSLNQVDIECSQNLMKLGGTTGHAGLVQQEYARFHGDWSILDKLLSSHQRVDQFYQSKGINYNSTSSDQAQHDQLLVSPLIPKIPYQYLGSTCESEIFKYTK